MVIIALFAAFGVNAAAAARPPSLTPSSATFAVPGGGAATYMLRLWSKGVLEGADQGTSGMLSVAVPTVPGCAFQADVRVRAGNGQWSFYSGNRATFVHCGPPKSTLSGDIYLCSTAGAPTTTEVAGGTLAATGPQSIASQANPLPPTAVTSGTYTMTAGAPSGYVFVDCGGTVTIGSEGTTATESVIAPSGGTVAGNFYVVVAGSVGTSPGGSGSTGSSPGNSPSGSTPKGATGPSSTLTNASRPAPAPVAATPVSSSGLAFTGQNTVLLLLVALASLTFGGLCLLASRLRRLPVAARSSTESDS